MKKRYLAEVREIYTKYIVVEAEDLVEAEEILDDDAYEGIYGGIANIDIDEDAYDFNKEWEIKHEIKNETGWTKDIIVLSKEERK